MSKALFDELVITYMDVIFGDTLDMLDENKVDKIIQSLSTILLKDRHSYYEGKNWKIGEIAQGLDFDEVKQLAYSPSYEKTLKYISQEGNSVLYVYFFLTEWRKLVQNTSDSFCYKEASQIEETKVLFFQMHELYNESIAFVSKPLQKIINDEVNECLRDIDL